MRVHNKWLQPNWQSKSVLTNRKLLPHKQNFHCLVQLQLCCIFHYPVLVHSKWQQTGVSSKVLFETWGRQLQSGRWNGSHSHKHAALTTKWASTAWCRCSSSASPTILCLCTSVRELQMAAACLSLVGHCIALLDSCPNLELSTGSSPSSSGCRRKAMFIGWIRSKPPLIADKQCL